MWAPIKGGEVVSFTRKADYALVAMAELARRAPDRLSARRIASIAGVPLPVLTNVLHQLLHHGLVASTRGAQGGYCLTRRPADISLADVIEAVEGPVMLTRCCPGDQAQITPEDKCLLEPRCMIKEPVRRVHQSLRQFLSQVDLAYIAFGQAPVRLNVVVGDGNSGNKPPEPLGASRAAPIRRRRIGVEKLTDKTSLSVLPSCPG